MISVLLDHIPVDTVEETRVRLLCKQIHFPSILEKLNEVSTYSFQVFGFRVCYRNESE